MSARVPPAPRDWVGAAAFPWPPTRALADGAEVRACYCVVEFQLARTRADQPYLRLTLCDRYGPVEARAWSHAEEIAGSLRAGGYIGVQGRIEYFNGQLQLCVDTVEPVAVGLEDLALFLPCSTRSRAEMEQELQGFMDGVADPGLRALLEACLGPASEAGAGFRLAPAAKYNHHAYLGGLLEHTLSVTAVCAGLAAHYGAIIDRDLLVTAALLHDLGKVREIGAQAGFPYTDEGKLLGHILLGLEMVALAARAVPALPPARLLVLQHLIAAHQGRYEWQSPREPATLEALILHYADDLDAKLQQVRQLIAESTGTWTAYDRSFRREFLCPAPAALEPGAPSAPPDPVATPGPAGCECGTADTGAATAPAPVPKTAASAGAAKAGGGGAHRPLRGHGASNFHRLSEDTLDLFRDAGED